MISCYYLVFSPFFCEVCDEMKEKKILFQFKKYIIILYIYIYLSISLITSFPIPSPNPIWCVRKKRLSALCEQKFDKRKLKQCVRYVPVVKVRVRNFDLRVPGTRGTHSNVAPGSPMGVKAEKNLEMWLKTKDLASFSSPSEKNL